MRVHEFRETPVPNIIDASDISQEEYISAMGQILDGLRHTHPNGVAHRDLKPANILVKKKPFFKVVIADFGFSKTATATTLLTTFCGTMDYMAPEVIPGFSDGHGPKVDIWFLGVIVLEWIYGHSRISTQAENVELASY